MRIDYSTIGALAAEIGCRRTDLIALSPQNDPFYVLVPARREAAEWFAGLWTGLGFQIGSHPRRLHYTIVSQDPPIRKPNGEPYLNTENDWKYLLTSSLAARYLRLIPDGALADHRNDPPIINAEHLSRSLASCRVAGGGGAGLDYDMPDKTVLAPWFSINELCVPQPYLVEVWVEKSTQNDILVPLAQRRGFNLIPGTGETSEILAREAVGRAVEDGRPMRILYVSDFDPGGRSMPVALARKIEYWIREADIDLDVTLDPIVLTPEQCERYHLPRTPLKDTEKRAAKFEERFGSGATELDALEALHPGELGKIVDAEVSRYLDPTLTNRTWAAAYGFKRQVQQAEKQVHERFDISDIERRFGALIDDFKENVEALEAETEELWPKIAAELEAVKPEFNPSEMPEPRPATPPEAPLFDSQRDYIDQIDHYRAWQGRSE